MERLWLLKGTPDAKGWQALQNDSVLKKTYVISFDRDKWALVKATDPPEGYDGLPPGDPPDGLYLDNDGRPIYVVDLQEVHSARAVIKALGDEAQQLFDKLGDADLVLDRLGRAY
jgi:hypothetical protein